MYDLKFREYLDGVEFFEFDPRSILITTNDSIQVHDVETRSVKEIIHGEAFNMVSSLPDENLIVASTLNGSLNVYEFNREFILREQISLEAMHQNFFNNKPGKYSNISSNVIFNFGNSSNDKQEHENAFGVCHTQIENNLIIKR